MIATYLRETASKPFVWGENDCALWVATLIEASSGTDPAASFRGTYSSWQSCRTVLMEYGGLIGAIKSFMPEPTGECTNGVCLARVGNSKVCGILCEGRLFLKTRRGITSPSKFEIIEGWALW